MKTKRKIKRWCKKLKKKMRFKNSSKFFTKQDMNKLIKDSIMKMVPALVTAIVVGSVKKLLKFK